MGWQCPDYKFFSFSLSPIKEEYNDMFPQISNNDCEKLNTQIELISLELERVRNKILSESNQAKKCILQGKAKVLNDIRLARQIQFEENKCQEYLNNKKTAKTAEVIGGELSKYNKELDASTKNGQKKLLMIGGGIILIGLIAILVINKK